MTKQHERSGRDQQENVGLVWRQLNPWRWESTCGRYRIERFIAGEHEGIRSDAIEQDRYRVIKRTPQSDYEFNAPQASLETAQQACEDFR